MRAAYTAPSRWGRVDRRPAKGLPSKSDEPCHPDLRPDLRLLSRSRRERARSSNVLNRGPGPAEGPENQPRNERPDTAAPGRTPGAAAFFSLVSMERESEVTHEH